MADTDWGQIGQGILTNPLLHMGVGMLAANRGPRPFGNALMGGLLAGQNVLQMQDMLALRQMQMEKMRAEQEQREQETAELQQRQGLLSSVPEGERALAGLNPEAYAKARIGALYPDAESGRPVQVMTPNGPVWMAPRQAYGQPAVNNQWGVTISGYDEQGRPLMTFGEGGSGMSKSTQTALEKDIIDLDDSLAQYDRMTAAFEPRFQTLGNRWDNLKSAITSKLGYTLAPEAEAELQAFATHRREVGQAFSTTVNKFAGTAMTAQEAERVMVWAPNAGTGLWDGDDPVTMATKLKKGKEALLEAKRRKRYLLAHGIKHDFAKGDTGGIELSDIDKIATKRAGEITAELKAQGLSGDSLNQAVLQRMRQEFGQ